MTVVTAVLLALSAEGLKPAQDANIAVEKKTNILAAVRKKGMLKTDIEAIYKNQVAEMVIDTKGEVVTDVEAFKIVLKDEQEKSVAERHLPLYIYTESDGKKYFVMPLWGVGLWGSIWGYISISADDFNTVYGSYFDHKAETPGLGAEISTDIFQQQFKGKKIFDENNVFTSVRVFKKAVKKEVSPDHFVDGISGGTITSNGTDNMISKWVEQYLPYFEKLKTATPKAI